MPSDGLLASSHQSHVSCDQCHYLAVSGSQDDSRCPSAHCLVFDLPLYEDELSDTESEVRKMCREHGDFYIKELDGIGRIELFRWKMAHQDNELVRKVYWTRLFNLISRIVFALLGVIISIFSLSG